MRVGVIVAAQAPVPWLDEALESVLSQEPAPDEVVLVDHGSEPAIAPRAGVRGLRLDDPGGGPAAARQAGLEALADCDWVALADADDVWEPGKLAAQLGGLEENPQAGVCFGRASVVDAEGRPTGESLPELEGRVYRDVAMRTLLYERNPIPAASAMVRRHNLERAGGFVGGDPLPAGSDWELWLRLAQAGTIFLSVPDARIRYRRHPGGLTSSVSRLAEAGLEIHRRHAGLVDEAAARRAQAEDLVTLARGRIRERRYDEARAALSAAAELRELSPHERALRTAAAIPVLRTALGRRDPYA